MLPPRRASRPDTAATIPGRSADSVSTNSVIPKPSAGISGRPASGPWTQGKGGGQRIIGARRFQLGLWASHDVEITALSLPRDAASVAVGRQVLSGCLKSSA
jgi:hypothetical protein